MERRIYHRFTTKQAPSASLTRGFFYWRSAMTKIKAAYAYVVAGVSANPQITIWVAIGLIVLAKIS